eukprot:COSAG01_NODE_10062_length_2259_cov_3.577315_3_plen_94_part_00
MDVVDGMRMELLLAIRHLERQVRSQSVCKSVVLRLLTCFCCATVCCCQLENVRELEFESEEEEGQGDRRRILMVSNRCVAVRSALVSLAEAVD